MGNLRFAPLVALLVMALPAFGQTAAPAAKKPESAEAEAAMERIRRVASNPMRVILEASKIKRKGAAATDTEAAPDPVDAAHLRRTSARSGGAEAAVPHDAPAIITPRSAPVAKAAPAMAAAEPVEVLLTTASGEQAHELAPVPPLSTMQMAPAVAAVPEAAMPTATLTQSLAPPKLINTIEPSLNPGQADELARVGTILADLLIRADGTVAKVTLASNVPRQLQRAVMAAMEQWRFEPLQMQRAHRVQMVFGEK